MTWGLLLATSRIRHSGLGSTERSHHDCGASLSDKLPYLALSWGLGLLTFPSCLGVIQVFVFRPLQLTCAVRGASVLGFCSVALSGITSSIFMSTAAANLLSRGYDPWFRSPVATCTPGVSLEPVVLVVYGVCSSVIFLCLGGRFHSVLPSSLIHPGAFAKLGISATLAYASAKKKRSLQETGRRHGCHSCGRRRLVKDFIADHQPPNMVVREHLMTKRRWFNWFRGRSIKQAFYPQCSQCSEAQATYLRTTYRSKTLSPRLRHIVAHPAALRSYHVYLPLPFLIAMLEHLIAS